MEHSTENIHNLIESSHLHYITNKFLKQFDFETFRKMTKITKFFCHCDKNEFLVGYSSIQIKLTEKLPQTPFKNIQSSIKIFAMCGFDENHIFSMNYENEENCSRPCLIIIFSL